jgi:hypothetical protein
MIIMADYAGAVAAIKQRMIDQWVDGASPKTPIVFQNKADEYDPGTAPTQPWVYFEVIGSSSGLRGIGTPGSNVWLYRGFILGHVFVPINDGDARAQAYAVALGEIFRAQGFYSGADGSIVRTWAPQTDGGDSADDNGNWWRVTCSIPFEFYYRG